MLECQSKLYIQENETGNNIIKNMLQILANPNHVTRERKKQFLLEVK